MKILINTPLLNKLAGVSSHFRGLQPYWSKDVDYFFIGAPKWRTYFFPYFIIKFVIKILTYRPNIILLNPSMSKNAIVRDLIYMKIALLFGCKIGIMFHGFHVDEVKGLEHSIAKKLNDSSVIFVLANEFKQILLSWGVTTPIYTTTTQVSDNLIKDFSISNRNGKVKNILYLARVTKAKGIFVALEVFKILSEKYPHLHYIVVGKGKDLDEAIRYSEEFNIPNITFTGGLSGNDLIEEYKKADLYLFTSYHEGMPTSVLEAMAFGLPIITRPVGGLIDFFEDDKMGYIIDSEKGQDYLIAFDNLINNSEKTRLISIYNHNYAKKHFLASTIAPVIENYLKKSIEYSNG